MRLEPMRYKGYTWPHNPRTYTISFVRQLAGHKIPFGRHCLQDLGLGGRVLQGEGEFAGEGAYDDFRALASVFYDAGPGVLVHPVWQTSSAYFTQLSVVQSPLPDYVRYTFTFQEDFDGIRQGLRRLEEKRPEKAGAAVRQVAQGDTLWSIARDCGTTVQALLAANPDIKNPNLIRVGQRVVIPG